MILLFSQIRIIHFIIRPNTNRIRIVDAGSNTMHNALDLTLTRTVKKSKSVILIVFVLNVWH